MTEIKVSLSPFGQHTADELEGLGIYVPRHANGDPVLEEEDEFGYIMEEEEGGDDELSTCQVTLPKGWSYTQVHVVGGHEVIKIIDSFGRIAVVDDLDGGGVTILNKRQKPVKRS